MTLSTVFKQKWKKQTSEPALPNQKKAGSHRLKQESHVPIFLRRTSGQSIQCKAEENSHIRRKVLDVEEEDPHVESKVPQIQRVIDENVDEEMEERSVAPKLEVGYPDDTYEQEADDVADHVISLPDINGSSLQKKDVGIVSSIQGRSEGIPPFPGIVKGTVQSPGSGSPLPMHVRSKVEHVLGTDLSHVRIHNDNTSHDAAQSIKAKAFTHQNNIWLGQNQSPHDTGLMAHELTHVIQQSKRRSQPVIQRQTYPMNNPALTPDEMFQIITRERSWTFNPGGAPLIDPLEAGRGVGPAAGGKRAGFSVFAVIQVTDRNGSPVALTYGEHIRYGTPHAEQGAVAALNRIIPPHADLEGGRMTVVLDQVPCAPGRWDCMGRLWQYANQHKMELDIRLPVRESMVSPRSVSPRTAAMSAQRNDVPAVSLRRYVPPGQQGPVMSGAGGGPPVGGNLPAVPSIKATLAPAKAPSPPMLRQRLTMITQLQKQTRQSISFSNRLSFYGRVVSGLLSVLEMVNAASNIISITANGTVLDDAQRNANKMESQAESTETWVEDFIGDIPLITMLLVTADAIDRQDDDALFSIDESLTDLIYQLLDQSEKLADYDRQLTARSKALDVMSDFYYKMAMIPQGVSTAPNASALAMHISLQKLSGSIGSAAGHYKKAKAKIENMSNWLLGLSKRANREAWKIVKTRIITMMMEYDRIETLKKETSRQVATERRVNQIHKQLAEIEAIISAPVCYMPGAVEGFREQRDALLAELAILRGGSSETNNTSYVR